MIDSDITPVKEDRHGGVLLGMLLVMCLGCVFLSCGSDSTQVEESLSSAEVQSLVQVLNTVHALDLEFVDPNPWPCPGGGTISYALGITTNESGMLWQGSLDFTDCVANSVRGETFTLGGNSSASVHYDVLGVRTEGSATGEVTWRLRGRRGSCALDLNSAWDESGGRVAGTACDVQIDQAID